MPAGVRSPTELATLRALLERGLEASSSCARFGAACELALAACELAGSLTLCAALSHR